MYHGCIADTPLFREKRQWFRKIFPFFMKYVTGGYVGQEEAGERLLQCIDDSACNKSGVYWSWNVARRRWGGTARTGSRGGRGGVGGSGGEIFENEQSDAVKDPITESKMWEVSARMAGLTEKERFKLGI